MVRSASGAAVRLGAALAMSALFASCGGGGDDSGSDAADGAMPSLQITRAAAPAIAATVVRAGESILGLGEYGVSLAQRFAKPGVAASATRACANGGIEAVTFVDADGNGVVSAGDTVHATLHDCRVGLLGEVVNGDIDVRLGTRTAAAPLSLHGTVSLGATGIQVAADAAQPGDITARTGSFDFDWTQGDLGVSLTASSSSRDDLRVVRSLAGVVKVDAVHGLALTKATDYAAARSIVSFAFRYESELLGGSMVVSTPSPLLAYLDTYPEAGRLEIAGADTSVVHVRPNFVLQSDSFTVSLDGNEGSPGSTDSVKWAQGSTGYLWWDRAGPGPAGTPDFATRPFASTDFRQTAIDASRATTAEPLVRLQFSRPLAATTPALRIRFRGPGSTASKMQEEFIEADVDRQGAAILLRPRLPLAHGRDYVFEASVDGLVWIIGFPLQDVLGNAWLLSPGFLQTASSLQVSVSRNAPALLYAGAILRLAAASAVSTGGSVTGYRWSQLSGTPLDLSTPTAASTDVSLRPGALRSSDDAVVRLVVSDSAGEVEPVRVRFPAADLSGVTTLLYLRSSAGDYAGGGETSLHSSGLFTTQGGQNGAVTFTYLRAPNDFEANARLSLASADGAPLHLGAYEAAIRAPFHGTSNGLELSSSGRGCNRLFGRFDILDIGHGPDGSVTRIAVDFEQHCEAANAPPLFGAYRLNSSVPVRP